MRILYGVQTTGRGHLVRSRPIVRQLKDRGHEVDVLFSGAPLESHWRDPVLEPAQTRRGLTFVTQGGRIQYVATALQLQLGTLEHDAFSHRPTDYDLVISDYEPVSARVAWVNDIPSIGVGHLYSFAHASVPVAGYNILNRLIMKYFAPTSVPIGMHWHHFDAPVLPPSIPNDVCHEEVDHGEDFILVYLSFESLDHVVGVLREIPERRFHVYCGVDAHQEEGNVLLCPTGREPFLADLHRCDGVICNSGFSLISEALHLGKKVLTKPTAHQTEQESNGLALERLGLARVVRRLEAAAVRDWLEHPPPAAMNYPDVLTAVVDWIHGGQWNGLDSLANELWAQVGQSAPEGSR